MKCPTCGGPLKPSKKDPDYLLCYTCKKKFKVPQHQAEDVAPKTERMSAKKEAGRRDSAKKDSARKENVKKERSVREQKYSNIPPKEVRDKREREMKKAYDEMCIRDRLKRYLEKIVLYFYTRSKKQAKK